MLHSSPHADTIAEREMPPRPPASGDDDNDDERDRPAAPRPAPPIAAGLPVFPRGDDAEAQLSASA
jgi:hypothetical protein